jgi:hypothetical protein
MSGSRSDVPCTIACALKEFSVCTTTMGEHMGVSKWTPMHEGMALICGVSQQQVFHATYIAMLASRDFGDAFLCFICASNKKIIVPLAN